MKIEQLINEIDVEFNELNGCKFITAKAYCPILDKTFNQYFSISEFDLRMLNKGIHPDEKMSSAIANAKNELVDTITSSISSSITKAIDDKNYEDILLNKICKENNININHVIESFYRIKLLTKDIDTSIDILESFDFNVKDLYDIILENYSSVYIYKRINRIFFDAIFTNMSANMLSSYSTGKELTDQIKEMFDIVMSISDDAIECIELNNRI